MAGAAARWLLPLRAGRRCVSPAVTSAAPRPQKATPQGQHRRRLLTHCTTSCAVIRVHRTQAQPHARTQVTHSARTARARTVCHEFLCTRFRIRLLFQTSSTSPTVLPGVPLRRTEWRRQQCFCVDPSQRPSHKKPCHKDTTGDVCSRTAPYPYRNLRQRRNRR